MMLFCLMGNTLVILLSTLNGKADNVNLNQQKKLDTDFIRKWINRMEEIPFDSDRKMMSVKCKLHGRETILTKGAPDLLIEKCTRVKHENKVVDMTINEKEQIVKAYEKFSENGLRVLAFAYKETNHKLGLEEECDYTFVGLVAIGRSSQGGNEFLRLWMLKVQA